MERILSVCINVSSFSETRVGGAFPLSFTALHFLIDAATIIVDDDFVPLPVAFARGEDHGSGIFQHRDEVRHNERLGEQVFGGAEQTGALPFPTFLGILVIFPVTLPQGDVASFQPFRYGVGAGNVLYPCIIGVFLFPDTADIFLFTEIIRHQLFDGLSVRMDGEFVVVYRTGQTLLQQTVDVWYILVVEGLVAKCFGGIDRQFLPVVIDGEGIQFTFSDVGVGGLIVGEELRQMLFHILVQCLCKQVADI